MTGKARGARTRRKLPPLGLGVTGTLLGLGGGCLDNVDIDTAVLSARDPSPDCSDAAAAAGSCVVRCTPGMTRCSDALLQRCNEGGDAWTLVDQCGSAALCDAAAVACGAPLCAPREHRCTETGELQVCNADRTGFQLLEQCRSAAFCSAVAGREGCLGTACRAGRQQCNGAQIEQCREDRSGFDKVGAPCASAALCREGDRELPYCAEPLCTPGQFSCEGATLSRCSDDAVRFIPINECASPEACNATAQRCERSECAAGEQRCNGPVLQRCGASGVFEPLAVCAQPELCDPAAPSCLTELPASGPPDPSVLDGDDYRFDEVSIATVLDLGPMELSLPREWSDVDESPWTSATGVTLGPRIIASSDAARFSRSFDIPGVYFAATTAAPLEVAARLAEFDLSAHCTRGASSVYEDELYLGTRQDWSNCGVTAARTVVVVANDAEDRRLVTVVIVTLTAPRDDEALDEILSSFQVE